MHGRDKRISTYKMEMRIPHCVRTEVSSKRDIREVKSRYWANTAKAMRREESGNIRSTSVSRPYSHAGKCSAISKYSTIHGISQGKE